MIRIFYLDKDLAFYNDLKTWLPDYCILLPVNMDSVENDLPLKCKTDILLINPEYTGINPEYLKSILQKLHNNRVIFIADSISLPFVVNMVKSGAYSFFHKRKDKSMLIECIKDILYAMPIDDDNNLEHHSVKNIIGNSQSAKTLKNEILNYKGMSLNILIHGETGTGKELTAMALHIQNYQKKNAIVTVNCGAIPENLIESELFGTRKGAYTDARDRTGLFEKAHDSTIFLDEVAELSKSAQVKLLRVIEDGSFSKVGDSKVIKSDFNLITATNKNLKNEVVAGRFREDLFYRITSLVINIPPLRERKEDIFDLSKYFLKEVGSKKELTRGTVLKLLDHKWPGNIRELKQTIIRAEYLSRNMDVIIPDHIVYY